MQLSIWCQQKLAISLMGHPVYPLRFQFECKLGPQEKYATILPAYFLLPTYVFFVSDLDGDKKIQPRLWGNLDLGLSVPSTGILATMRSVPALLCLLAVVAGHGPYHNYKVRLLLRGLPYMMSRQNEGQEMPEIRRKTSNMEAYLRYSVTLVV